MKEVREDLVKVGKKCYYRLCKCGAEKNTLKTPYCPECWKRRREGISVNSLFKDPYMFLENRKKRERSGMSIDIPARTIGKIFEDKLYKFVTKIERRNGLASMEDIFIDLIDLYTYYGSQKNIDEYPVNKQLEIMWTFIKKKKVILESRKK